MHYSRNIECRIKVSSSEDVCWNIYIKCLKQIFKFTRYIPCIKGVTNVVQNDNKKEQMNKRTKEKRKKQT